MRLTWHFKPWPTKKPHLAPLRLDVLALRRLEALLILGQAVQLQPVLVIRVLLLAAIVSRGKDDRSPGLAILGTPALNPGLGLAKKGPSLLGIQGTLAQRGQQILSCEGSCAGCHQLSMGSWLITSRSRS